MSQQDSTGSQLSFGIGIFVIISKITDHGLLRVTVEAKNLLSSSKRFVFFLKLHVKANRFNSQG